MPTVAPSDALRESRCERHVVGSDHPEHGIAAKPGREPLLEEAKIDRARDVEEIRSVVIAGGEVLGHDRGAVQPFPDESVEVDGRGNAPPDDRSLDPGGAQDLRHLRDVAEHVRQIADRHRAPELLGAAQAGLEIAQRRLAVDEELVHQRLPGPDREPPGPHECANPLLGLGPDLEVVVHRRELSVEREAQGLVPFQPVRAPRRRRRRARSGTTGTAGTTPGPSACAERGRRSGLD